MEADISKLSSVVVFTNELHSIYASGQSGKIKLRVSLDGAELINKDLTVYDKAKCTVGGIGGFIRDALADKQKSVGDLTISLGSVSKSMKVIRCDRPYMGPAESFVKANFLNDNTILQISSTGPTSATSSFLPSFYAFGDSFGAGTVTGIRTGVYSNFTEAIAPAESDGIKVYTPNYNSYIRQAVSGFVTTYGTFRAMASVNNVTVPFEGAPRISGKTFLYENSFGLPESVFIPGTFEVSPAVSASEAVIGSTIKQLDARDNSTYSVSAENIPYWLACTAKSLLTSRYVEVADNQNFPSKFRSNTPVTITSVSGNIAEAPDKLSSVKITYKFSNL